MKKQSKFQTWLKSFYASDEELAAYELFEQSTTRGSTLIDEIERGETIQVTGIVKSATVKPNSQVPAYEVEISDGSGSLIIIWQGRKHVAGIEPGAAAIFRRTGSFPFNTNWINNFRITG